MGSDITALASPNLIINAGGSSSSPTALARDAERRVVLLGAAHVIREVLRGGYVIELRRRKLLPGPRFTAVDRDVAAAVVAIDHSLGVVGRDPQVVIVSVGDPNRFVSLTSVGRFVEAGVEHIHGVPRLGIGIDPCVIKRPLSQPPIFADPFPCRAAIVRDKY